MLCSVLIPTRRRVSGLTRAIASLCQTADPANFDVRLRVDDDDGQTLAALSTLTALYRNLFVSIGPRENGYTSLGKFITELAAQSQAAWVTMLDDDVTLEGKGWDTQLAALPLTGMLAAPEFYHLGPSRYGSGSCAGPSYVTGWFAPNGCWLPETIGVPVDAWMQSTLVRQRGWRVATLAGITYNHQRDEAAITKERATLIA